MRDPSHERTLLNTAFFPLILLLLGISVWTFIHVDTKVGWIAAVIAGLGFFGTLSEGVWKLISKRRVLAEVQRLRPVLESRRTAKVLWACFAVLAIASLMVTSVHVEATSTKPVAIMRFEQVDGEAMPRMNSWGTLHAGEHLITFLLVPPLGRTVWLTADSLQSDSRRALPWVRTGFRYDDDFRVIIVNLLPLGPDVVAAMRRDTAGVRLLVQEDASPGDTLLDVRLRRVRAVLLAPTRVTPSDTDSTRTVARWADLMKRAGSPPEVAIQLTSVLWPPEYAQTRRPLRMNERLRYRLLDAHGTTIRRDTFSIRSSLTDEPLSTHP